MAEGCIRAMALAAAFAVLGCDHPVAVDRDLGVVDAVPDAHCSAEAIMSYEGNDMPCRVVAARLSVRLPPGDGRIPDPNWQHTSLAMDSRGQIYASALQAPVVLVYDSLGTFVRTIGGAGSGPGEFSPIGNLIVSVDPADTLVVFDGGMRASFFSPDGQFARMLTAPPISRGAGTWHFTVDGLILSSGSLGHERGEHRFWFTNRDGQFVHGYDNVGPRDMARERRTAYTGGETFWVLASDTLPLVLEELNFGGERLRRVTRDLDWSGDVADLIAFTAFHGDSHGMLWIVALTRDRRWRRIRSHEEEQRHALTQFDLRFAVYSPSLDRFVAAGFLDDATYSPLYGFLSRTTRTYRPVIDEDGLATIEFFDLHLIAK